MIHVPAEPAATAAAPPAHAVAPAFEQRLEEARQAGPSMWIHEQLLALRDLARAAGVEQWEMIFALTTHAIALARPDETSRAALAQLLVRDALKLDADAVADVVARGRWQM